MPTILAIETSCDETAAAIYRPTEGVLSSVLFSQTKLHEKFGGVVPEIASRSHLEKIHFIVGQALQEAGVTLKDLDAVAITNRPGLPGSLLVGLCFGKALAWSNKIPVIGVHHIEGHIFSSMIENTIPFPHLCLTASGGHTSLYRVNGYGDFTTLGTTRDDAAGEAFDKIAKLMELPYPGGPVIEQLARSVNFGDFFSYPRTKDPHTLDFSFSGLKTAVLYDLVARGAYDLAHKRFLATHDEDLKKKVASSLLVCIGDIFVTHLERAYRNNPDVQAVTFVGGVACNQYLRDRIGEWAKTKNISLFFPAPRYCTDNAAMIAFVGSYMLEQGKTDSYTLDIQHRT